MIKIIIIPLILICSVSYSQQNAANKYIVKKSTITTVASSNVLISEKSLKILQSVGQSGIIRTRKVNNYVVQQGYLNSNLVFLINNSNNEFVQEIISFSIYPNPFVDFIKIDFAKKTKHNIHIKIFDINGKVIVNQTFNPTNEIVLPLKRISIGSYLINVTSGGNSSTKKILKEN